MKIQISFEFRKKTNIYLMKIKTNFFEFRKKIRYVFNENTDQL